MAKGFWPELGGLTDPSKLNEPIDVMNLSSERLSTMLKTMLLIRRSEEAIGDLVTEGIAGTPCHLGIGQEAVAAGVCVNLTEEDRVFGGHRSHGPLLAMGTPVTSLLSEVLGRSSGCSGGMGGSMHLQDMDRGFWGSAPIVGGTVPISVGAALAAQFDGTNAVSVCFFGDGALEEGGVQESLNLAATMELPVIFVCENNLYASHMDISQRQPSDRAARFADANKIRAETIDGNDVVAVANTSSELIDFARSGKGPAFLEAVTYRWRGHVGPREDLDVGVRRRPDDLAAWKGRDPIRRLRDAMIAVGHLDRNAYERLDLEIIRDVSAARAEAIEAPYPDQAQLRDLVWSN